MIHYKHITSEEHEKILLLHSQNCTITYIVMNPIPEYKYAST